MALCNEVIDSNTWALTNPEDSLSGFGTCGYYWREVENLSDQQLLSAYGENQSEEAFGELVRRYVDFVYSAALRLVCDIHLAQDVTQSVFLALAQNPARLGARPVLSGWLHRTTQNIASKLIRTEVRRRVREQEAVAMNALLPNEMDARWEDISPQLDTALGDLDEADRDAILLRYFEGKSAHEMAQVIGVRAEAAQKRVNRALERLRLALSRRGVTACTVGLATVIPANAVHAAPIHLPSMIVNGAAYSAAMTNGAAVSVIFAKTFVAKALIATVLAAAVGVASYQAMRPANKISRTSGTTTASGLKYQVIKRGAGDVHPTENDVVRIHYRGSLLDGAVFENSEDRGQPLTAPLKTLIPGWVEGVQLMRTGDRFRFEIPPHLAYGDQRTRQIPPNSTLIFEIELLAVN